MDMGETWGIRDNGISHEGGVAVVTGHPIARIECGAYGMGLGGRAESVASFDAGAPAADEHLGDAFAALTDLSVLEGVEARHETRVLDHEGHELSRVAADAEEL